MPLMIRDFGVRDVVQPSLYSVIPYTIGTSAGIVAPWAIGRIRSATGSMDDALLLLGAPLVLSTCVLLAAGAGTGRKAGC